MTKIQKAFWFTYKEKYKSILKALKAKEIVDQRDYYLDDLWDISGLCGYCANYFDYNVILTRKKSANYAHYANFLTQKIYHLVIISLIIRLFTKYFASMSIIPARRKTYIALKPSNY